MSNNLEDYTKPIKLKPICKKDGELIFYINKKLVNKDDEIALGLRYVCNRYLFGLGYRQIMRDHFEGMGKNSGVLIKPFTISGEVFPTLKLPGDIDFLIIPYEDDKIIISKTMAIELKIIRAKFIKQHKSPNEFGFSQAKGLIEAGFPYVAVTHLIISDQSPEDHWRDVLMAKIINAESGEIELLDTVKKDMMPSSLMERAMGRLVANCPDPKLGLLATYFEKNLENGGNWFPIGRIATFNNKCRLETMDKIAEYYYQNYESFLDTRKYPENG